MTKKQTIEIHTRKTIKDIEVVPVEAVKFISPAQTLNSLGCSACKRGIGEARPIAIGWGGGRTYRLCHACSAHLGEERGNDERGHHGASVP